ncbi:MAG: DarT ssDNA thymidine ADP-ribosyltransferase family protein, partial [Candidatus Hydrogenedentales bacterium]
MSFPTPSLILRFIHVDNLHIYLKRGGIYAPNFTPDDGLEYKTNHNADIQRERSTRAIPCGLRGVVHDYVPFYFGYLSPMMLNLKTGRVSGYTEGQEPLIYLVACAQDVQASGA